MKILVGNEIARAIRRGNPSKIAVAYIGNDWKEFLPNPKLLDGIIVSPTFGSNPRAIAEIVKKIGWDKVFFLDELHAKIYFNNTYAVIGSANLTRNGLGEGRLAELCIELTEKNDLRALNEIFENLKLRSQKQYPTQQSKQTRLKELEKIWGSAIANKIIRDQSLEKQSFSDFQLLGEDHFYVLWYQPVECEYSNDLKAIEPFIQDEIHFSRDDKVEKNKWALIWRITNSSMPYKNARPHWLYIHDVFDYGIKDKDYDYPKIAIQRNDLDIPKPPFEITGKVSATFKEAVQERDIAKYLIQDREKIFNLEYSLKGIPLLVAKMKQLLVAKK